MTRLALLAALLLGACSDPPCQRPAPGPCKVDADCVLAECADAECGGAACGAPVAVRQLKEQRCLVAFGAAKPDWCKPFNWHPGFNTCPKVFAICEFVAAACRNGVCTGIESLPDGGPG